MCYGLRKKAIQNLLNIKKNTRFSNNAVLRPIKAKFFQARKQTGLVDTRIKRTFLKADNMDTS